MSRLYSAWKTRYQSLLEDRSMTNSLQLTALALILLGCLIVRLIIIEVPPLDRTKWKEIDYIEISKNYVKNDFNFFKPEITWPAEPPRVTAMEFPLVPFAAAVIYKVFGYNVFTVRLIPLTCWLVLVVYVFLLARRELGAVVGLGAAMAAAIMPVYHEFRNILFSEPFVIASSTAAVYYFANWIDLGLRRDRILAVLAFSLAVALKLEPLYLLLPLFWVAFRKYRFEIGCYGGFLGFIFLSMLLPVAWYAYAYYLTKTSIDVFGIFEGHDKMQTLTMLSDTNWYRVMFDRLRWDILGSKIGIILLLAGIGGCTVVRKGGLIFAYLIAIGCFFGIVAEGQIDAPYRQLTMIPPAAIFMGAGAPAVFAALSTGISLLARSKTARLMSMRYVLPFVIISFALLFANNTSKIFYKMAPRLTTQEELAVAIRNHAKNGSKLIMAGEYTIHKGGYDLSPVTYYYTGLQGWTLRPQDWTQTSIDEKINKGATLFAAVQMARQPESDPFLQEMRSCYKLLYENKERDLLVLDLLGKK